MILKSHPLRVAFLFYPLPGREVAGLDPDGAGAGVGLVGCCTGRAAGCWG